MGCRTSNPENTAGALPIVHEYQGSGSPGTKLRTVNATATSHQTLRHLLKGLVGTYRCSNICATFLSKYVYVLSICYLYFCHSIVIIPFGCESTEAGDAPAGFFPDTFPDSSVSIN